MEKLKWTTDASFHQFQRPDLVGMLFWANVQTHTEGCEFCDVKEHSDGQISCIWVDIRYPNVQNVVFLTASQEVKLRRLRAI
ncbi:MAG: hypothetical protein PVI90_00355 [Desulfobacteraceae bacterium]|jgi:hypothetical protein